MDTTNTTTQRDFAIGQLRYANGTGDVGLDNWDGRGWYRFVGREQYTQRAIWRFVARTRAEVRS